MEYKEEYMNAAIEQAKKAYKKAEAPIGAVIVKDGKIISKGYNLREKRHNSLCHAEIIAIDKACKKLKAWRLMGCDLYVTLEPCPMCAGAIIQSRIENVYFGAYDAKNGAAGSVINLFETKNFNHIVNCAGGFMKNECGEILTEFFRELRHGRKSPKSTQTR